MYHISVVKNVVKSSIKLNKKGVHYMTGQVGRIFEYLKANKKATGLELWRKCGAMSWAKKISLLKDMLPEMGYKIVKQRIKVYSKFAKREVYVMEYNLIKLPKTTNSKKSKQAKQEKQAKKANTKKK